MEFNDTATYFVPAAESDELFAPDNLRTMSELCAQHKRPRITTHRMRKIRPPRWLAKMEQAQKAHHVSFN